MCQEIFPCHTFLNENDNYFIYFIVIIIMNGNAQETLSNVYVRKSNNTTHINKYEKEKEKNVNLLLTFIVMIKRNLVWHVPKQ